MIVRSITSISSACFFFLLLHYSAAAGVNASIMVSMMSFTIVISAVLFYFLYREKLSQKHLIGMLLMVISIMAAHNGSSFDQSSTDGDKVSVTVPTVIVLILCVHNVIN